MNTETIQKILTDAVTTGDVAGVAAAVIGPSNTVFEGSAGTTILSAGQPVGPDTMFWIASMTKPLTSVAAMQLVEQGKLELDAPISNLLPELKHRQILENGTLRAAKKQVTLRHLLTHTSGFSYGFTSTEYAAYIAAQPNPPPFGTRASLDMPLLFEPGERWEYGLSTDWVGLAVEAASGEKLDEYFQNHICAPLGMVDTVFVPRPEQYPRLSAVHRRQADGSLKPQPPASLFAQEIFSGGGGLFSTIADYQKFLKVFLNQGNGIISPESIAEMCRNQIGHLRAGYLPSADPTLATAIDANPGQDNKWGLGFLIYPETGPFGRSAGSLSWSGMANTYFWIDPALNLAAVILMQILPSGDIGALKTFTRFEKTVYAASR